MNLKLTLIAAAAAVALAAGGYAIYHAGMARGMQSAPTPSAAAAAAPANDIAAGEAATRRHLQAGIKAGDVDPANGRRVLYYHDPMVPGKRFDAPGKSPFMEMMLVPVYGDGGADQGQVSVSPRVQQSLGVRTAEVTEGVLQAEVTAVGSIAYNEREQWVVQARASGFVERLHVRATLDRVVRGQPLLDLYVPDWVAAQEEYLAVRRMAPRDAALLDAARQRMRLAGMSDQQVLRVDTKGEVQPRLTLAAPGSGVIAELPVREGMTVSAGTLLARIHGVSTVWALAELPESQAALVRPGTRVQARTPALPGEVFEGTVQALLPEVNPATRTLRARVELANRHARLSPGMFVQMQFVDRRTAKAALVPTEALIHTGRRTVVLLAEDGGRFTPVEVRPGLEAGGRTEIHSGLQPGQRVVVSSQFLIDSEASLKGVEARLNAPAAAVPAASGASS
ncbi:efflux RND transporter periplasmic adaptor subunit [Piscinibacter sp. XHJ-5]|uniref:efflux RND transporter periplasmic adaptor subunit n=1 Tax=Piscinibacter sp. XHJ-5 TaxID=3037797 RepID=UPI002452CBE4|nr:efflux RND transporter periplasmic adaptor subunit [Piscinibacter sp. XHJ-5]